MAAQNIFQSYLQPVKSVTDYMADYDAQDMRKLQLVGAQRQNELAALSQRQQVEASQQNALERAARLRAAQEAGGDEVAYAKALRLTGFPGNLDAADKVEKAIGERKKLDSDIAGTRSQNAKRDTETENAVVTMWRDMIGNAATPQQAAQMVTAMHSDPRIANTPIAKVPLEQGLAMLESVPFDQWKQQFALGAAKFVEMNRPQYITQNLGGTSRVTGVAGLTGQASTVTDAPITQSADNRANNARIAADAAAGRAIQVRGQDLADARQREANAAQLSKPFEVSGQDGSTILVQQTKDGRIVPVQGYQPKGGNPKVSDAREALALLDQAETLVKDATGSTIGAGVDAAAKAFGIATPGSIKAQQLKALEGALVAKMPKMSGPQSDKDVMLYKQMAAEIGDPTVPYERKAAAMGTVREIQERYAGMAPGTSKPKPKQTGGATGSFEDPDKERRYQEWKRQQGQQ